MDFAFPSSVCKRFMTAGIYRKLYDGKLRPRGRVYSMNTGVSLMLTYLYPQTSTLEDAIHILADSSNPDPPLILPNGSGEDQTYLKTCREALVGCDYPGKLEELAGKVDSLLCGYETRQRMVERRDPSLMLKSIVTAVKSVSNHIQKVYV